MNKINKIKRNKTLAWGLVFAFVISISGNVVWSDEPESEPDAAESETQTEELEIAYDVPERSEDEAALTKMVSDGIAEKYASNEFLELYVINDFSYVGKEYSFKDFYACTADGKPISAVGGDFSGMFEENQVPLYNEKGEKVLDAQGEQRVESLGGLTRETADDGTVKLVYKAEVFEDADKIKEEGVFAVKNLKNGFVWWSNPINASFDKFARSTQVGNLSSPVIFRAGNPITHTEMNVSSNYINEDLSGGSANYSFKNYCKGIDSLDNGAKFNYDFNGDISLSMTVVLDGDSVLVTVPEASITEKNIVDSDGTVMLVMSLLNSFGAAKKEDGYIVVPDGSGAVINFDNGKTSTEQYYGQVYGKDKAVSQKFAPKVTQQVYLPVFGIVRDKGENALVAIAEKGDENAIIRAAVSGQGANKTEYNLAWFDFQMRTTDSFYIGTDYQPLSIYESEKIKTGDIAVRYYPLSGENLSYFDVAEKYHDYLIDKKGLQSKDSQNNSGDSLPFYATLNGGTVKTHSIMGFPIKKQTAATTYSQAAEISSVLKDKGVGDLVITYNDVNKSSIKREVTATLHYSPLLGGKKDYQSMAQKIDQNGHTVYPSMGFMEFYKSGGGYNTMLNVSKEVTRSRAVQQKYELAFGTPDPYQDTYAILSPYYFDGVFDKIIDSLKKEGVSTISLDQATYLLYSDFSRKNPSGNIYFNRKDTKEVLMAGFQKLNDAGISIMAKSANAYALPYVSHISDVPLYSSNYDIFDYDVPFYQIALRGIVSFSTKPFNKSSNLDELTLLALATGTPIHYEFIYADPGDFSDSEYNKKFYTSFSGWLDDSVEKYNLFNSLIGDTAGQQIIGHEFADGGTITTFENGKTVYVNLSTKEIKVDGESFSLDSLKGGDGQ